MSKVLVIDDDRAVLRLVQKALHDSGDEVLTARNATDGLAKLKSDKPDTLLLDIMLPDKSGIDLAREIREFDAKLPVIFITVSEDSGVAIEAMKLGAYDYVIKPLGVEQIQDLVERGLETRRLMQAPVHLHETDDVRGNGNVPANEDILVGRSPQMLEVYKQIGRVAAQDVSILIRGESGTGKELIARALYQHSHRNNNCFLAVNCAALSDTLLESELFGHEKGAFTGADRKHVGKFEQCSAGTIFLDEVGDMSALTQSKVLRLLQEQTFERVGGSETIQADVRIISATNRDLEQMIEDNEYRLDLLHRLNAFEIHLPPLRERGDDIKLLLEHFLVRYNHKLNKSVAGISHEAMEPLLRYAWPGNIRELQSVLRKAMLMATGPVLVPECFPKEIYGAGATVEYASDTATDTATSATDFATFINEREAVDSSELYTESLEWMERLLLSRVLQKHAGNQSKAAEQLGITRGSLRHKIKTLRISINNVVDAEGASS
jgi:DNA-binding NtrC family response regulator